MSRNRIQLCNSARGRGDPSAAPIPQRPSRDEIVAAVKAAAHHHAKHNKRSHQGGPKMSAPQTIPLVLVAAETGQDPNQLERDLDGHVHHDAIGLRVIDATLAAAVICAHREAVAVERERREREASEAKKRRAQERARREAERAREEALYARQAELVRANPAASAFDVMLGGEDRADDFALYGNGWSS